MTLRFESPRPSPLIKKLETPKELRRPEPVKPLKTPTLSRADTFQPATTRAPVQLSPTPPVRGNAAAGLATGVAPRQNAIPGLAPGSTLRGSALASLANGGSLPGKALATLSTGINPRESTLTRLASGGALAGTTAAGVSDTAAPAGATPSYAVTEGEEPAAPPTQGAAAAQRVNDAYANTPEEERAQVAAETLQHEAERLKDDPEALAALYAASEETVQAIATDLGRRVAENDDGQTQETLRALAIATDHLGAEATQEIGAALAQALPEQSNLNQFDDALHDLAEQGLGLNLSTAVVSELGELGKTAAANELTDVLTQGLSTARAQFEEAQARVDELNEELAYLVQSNSGLLSQEQLEAAVNDFKQRNAEAYGNLEREAAEFSQVLDSVARLSDAQGPAAGLSEENRAEVLQEANRAIVNVFPRLGDTEAGATAIATALEAQGRGEPTFLDQVSEVAQNLTDEQVKELASEGTEAAGLDDHAKLEQRIAETLFKSATLHIAVHPDRAQGVLDGLKENAGLLGTDPARLQTLADDVTALAAATDPAEIQRLQQKIQTESAELPFLDPSTRAGQAFRGFATVFGLIGAVGDAADWSTLDLTEKVRAVGGALETGVGAYETILGVAGRASSIAPAAARAAGVLGGLGAVLDGISAVEAFREGNHVGGAGYTASAVGGAILTAAAFSNAVPVGGQIVAGVLVAVGFGLQQWAHVQEANKYEGPTQEFLEGAGLSAKLAEELSNHSGEGFPAGPALAEVAKHLDIAPEQLIAHLETLSEDELQRLVEDAIHSVEAEGEGDDRGFPESGEDAERIRDWNENGGLAVPAPDSIEGLAVWMERLGYLPEGTRAPA
ncbi:MAG TPA: hypothetical protein VK539_26420 [Myxococcaceae bacterium]|nr:hypothetical protein [Myxococcaceae bacterium]